MNFFASIGASALRLLWPGVFFCAGLSSLLQAAPSPGQPAPSVVVTPELHEALRALVVQIGDLDKQIAHVEEVIRTTSSEELRSLRVAELTALQRKRSVARLDLLDIVSNADLSSLQKVEEKPFSLQGAMEDIIKPLVEEGRRATAGSQERRNLEDRYHLAGEQTVILKSALDSLDQAIKQNDDPAIVALLTGVREEFGRRYEEANSELTVLTYRLGEIHNKKLLLVDETAGIVVSFFRERGRNLLFAVLAGVVIAVGLRLFHEFLRRHTGIFRQGRNQAARLFDVVLYLLTGFGALLAVVIVLLNAGDWVLLGLVILFVLALVFTVKDALPAYLDQIRVMLNFGSVREGERIVFNGVPWLVEDLSYFTILRNPALHGGMVRLPIALLTGLLSRPSAGDEPYFPSAEGEWVMLDDGNYGSVVFQSVEMVRLRLIGGALKMYPTVAYLGQNPRNHSQGFRITSTLGLDYKHQPVATEKILSDLNQYYREEVARLVDPAAIRDLKIEFALANTSTLDYNIMLDLTGAVAPDYYTITRGLQRIGVDASNRFGLTLPFQQITLHQASA